MSQSPAPQSAAHPEGLSMLEKRKIEAEMTYPGQIKVTVIRESRTSELAH